MQVELRHQPSSAVARLHVAAGEGARARPGTLAAMTMGVQVEEVTIDGVPVQAYRAHWEAPGWVEVAASLPGDLHVIELRADEDSSVVLARTAWLAAAESVVLAPEWEGAADLGLAREVLLQAYGLGALVLSCHGAFDRLVLRAGEGLTVDAGHLVAYDATTRVAAHTASPTDQLLLDIDGPGTVLTQTRRVHGPFKPGGS